MTQNYNVDLEGEPGTGSCRLLLLSDNPLLSQVLSTCMIKFVLYLKTRLMWDIWPSSNLCPNCWGFSTVLPVTPFWAHFATSPTLHQLCWINNFKLKDICWAGLQRLSDKWGKVMTEERRRVRTESTLPVSLCSGVVFWDDGRCEEEVTVPLAKSLHYGLFSHFCPICSQFHLNPAESAWLLEQPH